MARALPLLAAGLFCLSGWSPLVAAESLEALGLRPAVSQAGRQVTIQVLPVVRPADSLPAGRQIQPSSDPAG